MNIAALIITYVLLSSGIFWFVTAVCAVLLGLMVSHSLRLVAAFAICTAIVQFFIL